MTIFFLLLLKLYLGLHIVSFLWIVALFYIFLWSRRYLVNGRDLLQQIQVLLVLLLLLLLLSDCGTLNALDIGCLQGWHQAHWTLIHQANRWIIVCRWLLEIHHVMRCHVEFIARSDISSIHILQGVAHFDISHGKLHLLFWTFE